MIVNLRLSAAQILPAWRASATRRRSGGGEIPDSNLASVLELDLLQVAVRRETSRFVAGVDQLPFDHNVKLTDLARLNVNWATPVSLEPSLHTEGFGFVASVGTVMNENRHVDRVVYRQKLTLTAAPQALTKVFYNQRGLRARR